MIKDEFRTAPRGDTLTKKKKMNRKVRNIIRLANKMTKTHNVKSRLVRKDIVPYPDNSGWNSTFWIEFIDEEHPERNIVNTYNYGEVTTTGLLFQAGKHFDSDLLSFCGEKVSGFGV